MSTFQLGFDTRFLASVLSIVLIDLLLAGDNAVVIAMAVQGLPAEQRRRGIVFGALAAVALRVVLTFFVAQLLRVQYLKLAGGLVILWIAMKLFVQEEGPGADGNPAVRSVWDAIRVIVVADITMSLDNMLAVGGASHGNLFLLLFGLALSIPFIILASSVLARLMARYPIILYAGAGVLGKVSAEMILTDPAIQRIAHPSSLAVHGAEALLAGGIVVAGWLTRRNARASEAAAAKG